MKRLALAFLLCSIFTSCSESHHRKETFPVTGTITVDGKPVRQLAVKCHPDAGIDKTDPTISSAFTDADGKFEISTYETGDGVPAGDYTLTITWGKFNAMKGSYGGDEFDSKYADPETSEFKFTVEPGKRTEPLTIDLTTKSS